MQTKLTRKTHLVNIRPHQLDNFFYNYNNLFCSLFYVLCVTVQTSLIQRVFEFTKCERLSCYKFDTAVSERMDRV